MHIYIYICIYPHNTCILFFSPSPTVFLTHTRARIHTRLFHFFQNFRYFLLSNFISYWFFLLFSYFHTAIYLQLFVDGGISTFTFGFISTEIVYQLSRESKITHTGTLGHGYLHGTVINSCNETIFLF